MTTRINTSCKHKRELYLTSRDSPDPKLKRHYKLYCKVLSNVILEAKQNNYNNQILNSNNNIKSSWENVKVESGKIINKNNNINIQEINVDGDSIDNLQVFVSVFKEYFLSVAEKTFLQDTTTTTTTTTSSSSSSSSSNGISDIKDKHSSTINSDPSHYLTHALNNTFQTYNSNFQQQKKLKASLNPLHLKYCNGPLPLNGQLVTDIVSAVTDADIVPAATAMHCDWVEAFHR
jgi:hypothetical protein